MRSIISVLVSFLAVAGCAQESRQMPVTSSTTGGPASKEPEAANSLPRGSAINGPLAPAYGDINTVQVGPATVVSQSRTRLNPPRTF